MLQQAINYKINERSYLLSQGVVDDHMREGLGMFPKAEMVDEDQITAKILATLGDSAIVEELRAEIGTLEADDLDIINPEKRKEIINKITNKDIAEFMLYLDEAGEQNEHKK